MKFAVNFSPRQFDKNYRTFRKGGDLALIKGNPLCSFFQIPLKRFGKLPSTIENQHKKILYSE